MENNMEKVVDLKERAEGFANSETKTARYLVDVRMFKDRINTLLDMFDDEVADDNGVMDIPTDVVDDFLDKLHLIHDNETLEYMRHELAGIFCLNPETATIGTMFGIYKEDENHIYTTV